MTNPNPAIYYRSILVITTALATTVSLMTAAPIFAQTSNNSSSMVPSQNSTSSMNNTMMAAASNNTQSMMMAANMTTMTTMMLNLGKPLFIEHDIATNMMNVSQNTTQVSFSGNGTFMLPSGNVSTTDSGIAIIYSMHGFSRTVGHDLIKTMDGKENATVNFVEIVPNNSTIGIGTAYVQTNSTTGQQLASLNNTIGVYTDVFKSKTEATVTFWKWK